MGYGYIIFQVLEQETINFITSHYSALFIYLDGPGWPWHEQFFMWMAILRSFQKKENTRQIENGITFQHAIGLVDPSLERYCSVFQDNIYRLLFCLCQRILANFSENVLWRREVLCFPF